VDHPLQFLPLFEFFILVMIPYELIEKLTSRISA
jgi:hypothetical protein